MLKDRRHGCPKAIRMTSDWRAPLSFTTMPLKSWPACCAVSDRTWLAPRCWETACCTRSEEHTSELQSRLHLVCRLLLEKKKKNKETTTYTNRSDSLAVKPGTETYLRA